MFATSAAKLACVAKDNAVKYGSKAVESVNESVVKPTAARVKDGEFVESRRRFLYFFVVFLISFFSDGA